MSVLPRKLMRLCCVLTAVLGAPLATLAVVQVPALASGGTTTGADLQMSGSASTGSPNPGASFTYTFQVKNAGPQTATGAVFNDSNYSTGAITSVAVNGNPSVCAAASDPTPVVTWTCSLGDMPSNTQLNVVETAVAPNAGGVYDNIPTVTSSVSDPNLGNNSADPEITVKLGGGGGGATATLINGPCVTVAKAQVSTFPRASTNQGATGTETMTASVTSCSALTQPNMTVSFDAGPGSIPNCGGCTTSQYSWVFTCQVANSFALSPGATVGVSCNVPYAIPPDVTLGGAGIATVYSSGQAVATGTYPWAIFTTFTVQPAPPPTCPRAGCIVF